MKFYISENQGFCHGVKKAVETAMSVEQTAYCLGDIVHNDTVTDALRKKGVITVDGMEDVPDGAVMIIRAHGAPPEIYDEAAKRNIRIADATCPSVRAIQQKAAKYSADGYTVVLAGEAEHPEIRGINGWCGGKAIVTDGLSPLDLRGRDKVLIMFQTTFDTSRYEKTLQNIFTDGVKTLEIFNTICYTTIERQNYARRVADRSDLAVVVGDKKSSNTKRLYETAKSRCETVWIDGCKDADNIDLTNHRNLCFISGASTPTELMKGVLERMTENAKEAVVVETVASDAEITTSAEEAVIADTAEQSQAAAAAEEQSVEITSETEIAAEQADEAVAEPEKTEERAMDKNEAMLAEAVSQIKEGVKYRPGQKVRCRVVLSNEDGVYVRVPSWKQEAFIPNEELSMTGDYESVKSSLKENDTLECAIISTDSGKITLSKKVIDERYKDDELVEGIKAGNEFEAAMTRVGKDCLTGKLGSYTVIVHASQIKIGFVKNLEPYVGKKLRLVSSAEKVDDQKRLIFASQKAILLAEKKAKEDEFWNNIEVDEIVEGTVMRFAPFGAFVSVRGFDCLAHTSDLSWDRISGPSEVLELNKTYEFVVLALDREKNRVSLGYKQLQPQPWQLAEEKFPVGAVVTGKVARIMPFGAFVELDKNIDGLLHVSNVSWEWLDDINKAIKVGDEIEVEIMEFDGENKRITLSRKALLPRPDGGYGKDGDR